MRRLVEVFYYGKLESVTLFPRKALPELYLSSTSYWLLWPEKYHVPVGQRGRAGMSERGVTEVVRDYCLLVQRMYPDAMGESQHTPRGWKYLKT